MATRRHHTVGALMVAAAACLVWLAGAGPAAASPGADGTPTPAFATAPAPAFAAGTDTGGQLSTTDGLVLGLVEGVTEYLPVSSTGHLVVTARLLDLETEGSAGDALDSYTIVIQVGAIAAVLLLYRRRVVQLLGGITGRDATGRRLLLALAAAFVPAALAALALEGFIGDHLLEPGPVATAWIVGGVLLVALGRALRERGRLGVPLEQITIRHALLIGVAQAVAVWPGVSRSLVTLVGGVLVGLTLAAAVEFSFLLGLLTLGAATGYEVVSNGSTITGELGLGPTVVGIAAAFVSAAIAVKFLVEYLNRRDLRGFGYYRVGVGVLTFVLLAAGRI
jgi:undecaprenyl-diphosphatase